MSNDYIQNLILALKEAGKDEPYIQTCSNYAERLIQNKLPVIFDMRHLCLLLDINKKYFLTMIFSQKRHYKEHCIPKSIEGYRKIHAPSATLKYIQKWILDNITSKMHTSKFATGFMHRISVADNAARHINKECVINIDISNFFHSIFFNAIFRIFYYYGYTKEISFILARLCTYEDVLPQGSPASPCLSNIYCLKLDKRIGELAKTYEATYSRYADDITISGNKGITNALPMIQQILDEEGFKINPKKLRIAYEYQKQEVTGLVVNNGKVRVRKSYKRALMQEIYFCLQFGVSGHLKYINSNKNFYKEHLYGKAYFLYMVEPEAGKKALKKLNEIIWDY